MGWCCNKRGAVDSCNWHGVVNRGVISWQNWKMHWADSVTLRVLLILFSLGLFSILLFDSFRQTTWKQPCKIFELDHYWYVFLCKETTSWVCRTFRLTRWLWAVEDCCYGLWKVLNGSHLIPCVFKSKHWRKKELELMLSDEKSWIAIMHSFDTWFYPY